MDTTQYTLDLEGARRYFADLSDMLEVYKDMEGFALSKKGKTINTLRDRELLQAAVQIAVCDKISELAIEYLNECVGINIEILGNLSDDKEEDRNKQENIPSVRDAARSFAESVIAEHKMFQRMLRRMKQKEERKG